MNKKKTKTNQNGTNRKEKHKSVFKNKDSRLETQNEMNKIEFFG